MLRKRISQGTVVQVSDEAHGPLVIFVQKINALKTFRKI